MAARPMASSSGDSDPALEIGGATVFRGLNRVFDDLHLRVDAGCHTAILGPNGAGKSTLLKLLTREIYPVHRPDTTLRLFGKERWNVWDLRRRLGIVSHDLQARHLGNPPGQHVILSGYYASIGIAEHHEYDSAQLEKAEATMEILGVSHLRDRPFASMSTGEQRRFLLGRALVHEPRDPRLRRADQRARSARDIPIPPHDPLPHRGRKDHHPRHPPPPRDPTRDRTRRPHQECGRIIADGAKDKVLTEEQLGDLFETRLVLAEINGYYQASPAPDA